MLYFQKREDEEGMESALASYWALNPGVSPGARTPKISSSLIFAWKANYWKIMKHLHSSHHLMLKNLPHTNQLVHPGCCVLFVQARFGWQGYYLVLAQITIWFLFTCYRRLYCWRRSHGHHAWERQTQIVIKRELYNVILSRYQVFLDWNLISLYLNLYLRSSTFS